MWVEYKNHIPFLDKNLPKEGFVKAKTVSYNEVRFCLSGNIQTLKWQFDYFGLNQL